MSYIGNEPIVSATRTVTEVTATAGQTVFNANGGYTVGYLDVFLNGSKLTTTDFTATNGSSITLTEAAQVGDIVRLEALGTFQAANAVLLTGNSNLTGNLNVSGNLGVGTTSPLLPLHVVTTGTSTSAFGNAISTFRSGAAGRDASIQFSDGTNTGNIGQLSGNLLLGTGGNERMRIDSSGNVGIGTSSPSTKLDVNVAGANGINLVTAGSLDSPRLFFTNSSGTAVVINNANGAMRFGTGATAGAGSGTEAMRIDSSGNLLVGTTSVVGTDGPKMSVSGNACIATNTVTTSLTAAIGFHNPNGRIGYIGVSGTTTSYVTSSDYRLKENIAPMTGALAKVSALKPVTYKWKADGSDGQGFIAHELQTVVPDCVTGEKDAVDAEGNPQYQGIDVSFLVATLTAAIQEQQAQLTDMSLTLANANAIIQSQADTITAMELRLTALEGKL